MPEDFIGRSRELSMLETAYESGRSGFIPIYGRRRVGKSELILRFLQDKPGLYYVGKRAPAEMQMQEFLQAAATVIGEPLLATFPAENWKQALLAVTDRWHRPEPLVIALDEFQWTAGASPELPSIIQECWDRHWRQSGKLMLILCGSFIGFMEREVLGRESPLFGRRTAQILLKPFSFHASAAFHPGYSVTDLARTYFLCGGVPLYLRCFSVNKSVEMNIAENFLGEFATLYREPDFLLREELRDVGQYYAVLLAVASGYTSHKEIGIKAGVSDRSLHYYLQQLLDLGYLVRRYPLTGGPASPRTVRYAIGDPLLRFWFRFVFPHLSLILRSGPQKAFEQCIRPELDAFFGSCFENLCREAMSHIYARAEITAPYQVGEYWDKNTQIDVIGYREDGWTDLGECKWGTVRSPRELAAELESRVGLYPNPRNATIGRYLFTRQHVADSQQAKHPNFHWLCLEDLYSLNPDEASAEPAIKRVRKKTAKRKSAR